jgi:predicted ATP-binding protein involved in virulence
MKISTLEITNIKGIGHKSFQLDLVPNKPNILVAPNGFGKSSIAIGFDSLRSNKIELSEKNYHKKDDTNRPVLSLTLSNNTTLTADDNQNTIKDQFDVVVIKNQTEPL